jgi:hypothetical protein
LSRQVEHKIFMDEEVSKLSSRVHFSQDRLTPKFAAALDVVLRRLDALEASTEEMHGYLTGLKDDFRLLRRQAGVFVREQGEQIGNLESTMPK